MKLKIDQAYNVWHPIETYQQYLVRRWGHLAPERVMLVWIRDGSQFIAQKCEYREGFENPWYNHHNGSGTVASCPGDKITHFMRLAGPDGELEEPLVKKESYRDYERRLIACK